jgi:hypothetical protein
VTRSRHTCGLGVQSAIATLETAAQAESPAEAATPTSEIRRSRGTDPPTGDAAFIDPSSDQGVAAGAYQRRKFGCVSARGGQLNG